MEKEVKFKLPESIDFPKVIFENANSLEGVKNMIAQSGFVAVQQKDVIANRIMDTDEINGIREEYGEIAETDLPSLYAEMAALEAKYKSDKKSLEGQISSLNTKFKDLVSFARSGIRDFNLDYEKTFCISVLKHYLFYTWVNGRFELALVQEIPDHKGSDVFNSIEKNKAVFETLGYVIPEIEIKDNRESLRRFSDNGTDYEVWEEKNFIHVRTYWTEIFADSDSGESVSINRENYKKYSKDDYPFTDIDPSKGRKDDFYETEKQKGETNDLSEESEE